MMRLPRGKAPNSEHYFSIRALAVLLPLLLISGCAFSPGLSEQQRSAVDTFGKSALALNQSIPQELVSMRNRTIRMRMDELAAIHPAPRVWPSYKHLDRDFEPQELQRRIAAAQALANYGDLLEKLVTSSNATALHQAVGGFRSSVANLADKRLTNTQLDAISEAVTVVAGIYIEHKRLEAMKTVVEETHDQVDALCDLLADDFNPRGLNMMSAVKLAAERLQVDANARLKDPETRPQNYGELVRLYWEGSQNEAYAEKVGVQTLSAINHLRKANDRLWHAVQAPEFAFSSPTDLESDVKEIQMWSAIFKN